MTQPSDNTLPTPRLATCDPRNFVVGAGHRLAATPVHVADQGKIGIGAGYRVPVERKTV